MFVLNKGGVCGYWFSGFQHHIQCHPALPDNQRLLFILRSSPAKGPAGMRWLRWRRWMSENWPWGVSVSQKNSGGRGSELCSFIRNVIPANPLAAVRRPNVSEWADEEAECHRSFIMHERCVVTWGKDECHHSVSVSEKQFRLLPCNCRLALAYRGGIIPCDIRGYFVLLCKTASYYAGLFVVYCSQSSIANNFRFCSFTYSTSTVQSR